MPPFTASEDQNLAAYLAHPTRIFKNFHSAELYAELGPGSEHKWSHTHKADGWLRRAKIEGFDGLVLRAAKVAAEAKAAKKVKEETKAMPEKKKVKTVTIGEKEKPKSTSQCIRSEPAAYDPQQDLELIAAENNVPLELVGDVYAKMKTVIKTMHMVETISAHMGPSASDHESDSDSDEDEERVIVKVEKKVMVKKRQHEEEEDSGEGSEVVQPRRKQVKSIPAPAKKVVKSQSKAAPKKKIQKVVFEQASDESDSASRPWASSSGTKKHARR